MVQATITTTLKESLIMLQIMSKIILLRFLKEFQTKRQSLPISRLQQEQAQISLLTLKEMFTIGSVIQ